MMAQTRRTTTPAAPTIHEIIARTKPLTGSVPGAILRAQSTDRHPGASDAVPCGSYSSPSSDTLWYCVRTHAKAEFRAVLDLSRMGFRPYCPMFLSQRQVKERGVPFRDVIEPLFPRYLFVAFDRHHDQWRRIFRADGIELLMIGPNERPMPVPTTVIEALRAQGRAGDGVIDMRTSAERHRSNAAARREAASQSIDVTYYPPIEPGQTVKILSGPFAQFHGICTMSANDRVRLLVEIFGRSSAVEVKAAEVEAV